MLEDVDLEFLDSDLYLVSIEQELVNIEYLVSNDDDLIDIDPQ